MSPVIALNPRERLLVMLVGSGQSEKAVGYTLGVRSSAVSDLLKAALIKLGMRSRTDLVLFVGALGLKPGDEYSAWANSCRAPDGPVGSSSIGSPPPGDPPCNSSDNAVTQHAQHRRGPAQGT
jgi:DNA-binding CsgD family transcriptional regulator